MSAVLDRVRGHLAANETGGFFTRDEMAAVVARLDEALAEVERLVRQHAAEMFAAGSAAGEVLRHRSEAIDALTAERDRLTKDAAEAVRSLADERDAARAERDRLAGQVQRVRDLHQTVTTEAGLTRNSLPRCVVCKVIEPCDTVSVLGPGGGSS